MPKHVDHEERRRQLAEAVVRVAASRGLHAVSMREVAAEAGVSLRLVQYYFHTKEELLTGTLRHLGDQLAARVERRVTAAAATPTPHQVLYGTLAAVVPVDEQSRQIMLAYTAFFHYTLTDPSLAANGLRYASAMEDFLAEKIEQAQAGGEIRPGLDPRQTAAAILALTNGLGLSVLAGQRNGDTALTILNQHLDDLLAPNRE